MKKLLIMLFFLAIFVCGCEQSYPSEYKEENVKLGHYNCHIEYRLAKISEKLERIAIALENRK